MDFDIKKPSHLFALLLISITFLVIIIASVISYFDVFPGSGSAEMDVLSGEMGLFFEIFLLLSQLILVIILLVIFPIIWYLVVNKSKFKEILQRLQIKKEGIDAAFLWGILSIIFIFGMYFVVSLVITYFGFNPEDQGNIEDIEVFFSPATMFILIAIQPAFEEIFFRGFLLDKINSVSGKYTAILITSVLFGLAHLIPGKIYPAFITGIIGVILAILVLKTKNLFAAIIAHTGFNIISYILYLLYS